MPAIMPLIIKTIAFQLFLNGIIAGINGIDCLFIRHFSAWMWVQRGQPACGVKGSWQGVESGEIEKLGRSWANAEELSRRSLTWLHTENKDEKIRQIFGGINFLLYFCPQK